MCQPDDREPPQKGGGGWGSKSKAKPDPDGWKNSGWVKKDEGDGWTLWGDP